MTTNADARRGRRNLLLLAALFLGPLVAAWLLYFGDGWRPGGSAANGELIDPVIVLDTEGTPFGGVWALTVAAGTRCGPECAAALFKVRQVRLSLGKDMDRIGRVLLIQRDPVLTVDIARDHPGLQIIDARSGDAVSWREQLPGYETDGAWIYLVDPLGNLMMRFAAGTEPRAIRDDLKRLLKYSRIG